MNASERIREQARRHPLAVASIALTAVAVAAMVYRWPDFSVAEGDRQALADQSASIGRNLRNAANLEAHLARLSEGVKTLESRLIQSEQKATNLQFFYQVEADTGVKILSINQGIPAKAPKGASYIAVPFAVSVEGAFGQIEAFLHAVEHSPYHLRLVGFTLQKASVSEDNAESVRPLVLNLNLEILGQS